MSFDLAGKVSSYSKVMNKGYDWLLGSQKEDGSFQQGIVALEAYYKSPLSFAMANRFLEGKRSLTYIVNNYMTNDGNFRETQQDAFAQRKCDLYRNFWIILGACSLERYDVAEKAWAFAMQFYDSVVGGFSSTISSSASLFDMRSAALGGLAGLFTGNLHVAETCGNFLLSILDLQPNLDDGFYIVCDVSGALVSNFSSQEQRYFVVSIRQARPLYYALGLAVAFLAKLYRETQYTKFLIGARKYVAVCEMYGKRIFSHYYSGKLGWGTAIMYQLTGEAKYALYATSIADYIASLQQPSGQWVLEDWYENQEQKQITTLDRTAEFSLWINLILSELRNEYR